MASNRSILFASLRGTHRMETRLDASGRVVGTTIINTVGEWPGQVVPWIDRSAEMSIEAEVQNVVRAANDGGLKQHVARIETRRSVQSDARRDRRDGEAGH